MSIYRKSLAFALLVALAIPAAAQNGQPPPPPAPAERAPSAGQDGLGEQAPDGQGLRRGREKGPVPAALRAFRLECRNEVAGQNLSREDARVEARKCLKEKVRPYRRSCAQAARRQNLVRGTDEYRTSVRACVRDSLEALPAPPADRPRRNAPNGQPQNGAPPSGAPQQL